MNTRRRIEKKHEKLNVLVVGCGYFGQKRLQAISELQDAVALVGIVDRDLEKAKTMGAAFEVPYADSMQEFDPSSVDAVIISTPNNTHSELAIEAMNRGWHVLVEKPLASTVAEASAIVKTAKRTKRIVKTGSNHRFFPTVQKAREIVESGSLGRVLSFRGSIGNNGEHVAGSWFWNKEVSGGGTFIDNGCHLIDIARMFMGDFVSCIGQTSNVYWKKTRVEDVGTGIFTTKDGRVATISSAWIQWHGYLYIELWLEKGFIIIDGHNNDVLTVGDKGGDVIQTLDFSASPKRSYHEEIQYFARCIQENSIVEPDARDGAEVVKMIDGVYRSTRLGTHASLM